MQTNINRATEDEYGGKVAARQAAIPVTIWKEGKWYVSYCPTVDIASQGRTAAEAKKNLAEALKIHAEEKGAAFKRLLFSRTAVLTHLTPQSIG